MLDARNILFPTDFSEASLSALEASLPFRDRNETTVHIFHLISWHGRGIFSGSEYGLPMPTQRRIIKQLEEDAREKLSEMSGADTHEYIQVLDESNNSVADSVLAHIRSHKIDMVVIGSDGRHEILRTLFGGTIEKILADSPVPVFSAGPHAKSRGVIEKILVAIDASDSSKGVLKTAAEAARMFNASLTVLHVVQPEGAPLAGAPGLDPIVALPDSDFEDPTAFIEALADENIGKDIDYEIMIQSGVPDREIERISGSSGADLLVVGTHGHKGLKRLFLGSSAQYAVHHAACPVLVISANCLATMG